MEMATAKQISFLQKLGAIFCAETITKKDASILIGRTLKANKDQTNTTTETTKKDNEPKQNKTLQDLLIEYNCGTKEECEGRFYRGNNADKLPSYYEGASEWLKAIKKIVLKEFNIKILASKQMATYTPSYTFTIKATPQEFYKSFEELKEEGISNWRILEEFQNHNEIIRSVFMNWEPTEKISELINNDQAVKTFYEWATENSSDLQMLQYRVDKTNCQPIKEIYCNLIRFLGALMTSYNYDHTGANMADTDYIDCSFFFSIDYENQHDITIQSKQIGELYKKNWHEYFKLYGDTLTELRNKVFHAKTPQELCETIKEYNETKAKFLTVGAQHE